MKKLYLASKSASRRQLLIDACIPFTILEQSADESQCDWGLTLERLALSIADHKMKHAYTPFDEVANEIFVLTADTVIEDKDGFLYAKPESRNHAYTMIKTLATGPIRVATGFVLEKRVKNDNIWDVQERILQVVTSQLEMEINDVWIECYLNKVTDYLDIAGALHIEGFGAQFIKKIEGSYSGILGLPICEVRQALEKLQFFERSL